MKRVNVKFKMQVKKEWLPIDQILNKVKFPNSVFCLQLVIGLILFLVTFALAKVGNPPPVIDGNIIYRSHTNYVEAVDVKSQKVRWKTIVYKDIEPQIYKPNLEKDVQWNIITSIQLINGSLKVTDSNGKSYYLDKHNGKHIKPNLSKTHILLFTILLAIFSVVILISAMIRRKKQ